MPSSENQSNLNTQHRKAFHKATVRINNNCLYAKTQNLVTIKHKVRKNNTFHTALNILLN